MRCPKCDSVLAGRRLDDRSIHACGRCGGTWFDRRELRLYLEQALERTGNPATVSVPERLEPLPTALACPACPDQRLRSVRLHGVEIDGCPGCRGVFLDSGELELLTLENISAALKPRMRRARAAEAGGNKTPGFDLLFDVLDVALSIFG